MKNNTKYVQGGNIGKDITCVNCGHNWNTSDSDEYDKYVCHKCGFNNRTYYDADPIDKKYFELSEIFKPTPSIKEISKKFKTTEDDVMQKLLFGIKEELEHTEDEEVAKIIASHHIEQNINYYDILKSENLENGGFLRKKSRIIYLPDQYCEETRLAEILSAQGYDLKKSQKEEQEYYFDKNFDKGGVVVGKSHQEYDENGSGEKFVVSSTGQIVELEGGESALVAESMNSDDNLLFQGKKMLPREIASFLNHKYGGVKFDIGGEINCGCTKKKYYHGGELPSAVVKKLKGGEAIITKKTMDSQNKYAFEDGNYTPREILSRINVKYGGVSFDKNNKLNS